MWYCSVQECCAPDKIEEYISQSQQLGKENIFDLFSFIFLCDRDLPNDVIFHYGPEKCLFVAREPLYTRVCFSYFCALRLQNWQNLFWPAVPVSRIGPRVQPSEVGPVFGHGAAEILLWYQKVKTANRLNNAKKARLIYRWENIFFQIFRKARPSSLSGYFRNRHLWEKTFQFKTRVWIDSIYQYIDDGRIFASISVVQTFVLNFLFPVAFGFLSLIGFSGAGLPKNRLRTSYAENWTLTEKNTYPWLTWDIQPGQEKVEAGSTNILWWKLTWKRLRLFWKYPFHTQ